jgi:N-acetylglucosaminyldiphosphoundecaprenol N-acetyl-beta-D-mannosaminyltransferase
MSDQGEDLEQLVGFAGERAIELIEVGPFRVPDATREEFVELVVALAGTAARGSARGGPAHVYALHVGGLNARHDRRFVDAMLQAELVGADGGSVVFLARLAGARSIERVPTTDVGWDILHSLGVALGRDPRVALVGGPPGLAERAGEVLSQGARVQVVHTDHGYHEDWAAPLHDLRASAPDLTLVGLGAPREMTWCQDNRDELPGLLVVTCGGWFGHLVGDEVRAPRLLRRSGVEWVVRLGQSPRRLGPRYARGLYSSVAMSMPALWTWSRARRR